MSDDAGPTTPGVFRLRVWPLLPSLAATERITDLFSFPPGTEMFHFPGFALPYLCIQYGVLVACTSRGFPHSGIHGSRPVSGSPWLIAAVHALHRLPSPRHPPCALDSLTVSLRRVDQPKFSHSPPDSKSEFDAHTLDCQRTHGSRRIRGFVPHASPWNQVPGRCVRDETGRHF